MRTRHIFKFNDASLMVLPTKVQLVITSPPYPMIEMWDDLFSASAPEANNALAAGDGPAAFEAMHRYLDEIWKGVSQVLVDGGIACINIGDATRTIGNDFQLYPNHARIVQAFRNLGFQELPSIIWRKQTNAPNKFMGSGMLPPGAYVTLEHEHVLIFRKGGKREFVSQVEKWHRAKSAYFWEERNQWFSDVWFDLKGVSQKAGNKGERDRSAAFPFELAYRLVNMFSIEGDTVLDPFLGTGTTTIAAMASARQSYGIEIDPAFEPTIRERIGDVKELANTCIADRLARHAAFVDARRATGKEIKYLNGPHGVPVVTRQEVALFLREIVDVETNPTRSVEITYLDSSSS
jgi:DNA modification methylase